MTQRTAPCALRALRELGYHWYQLERRDRLGSWMLMSRGELGFAHVYWNEDGYDVRLMVGHTILAKKSVDLPRGPKMDKVIARATAIMTKFRDMAERRLVMQSNWQAARARGGGGDARQRRKVRRRAVRLMAQAREEARKEVTP